MLSLDRFQINLCEEIGLVAFLQFFPLERQQWGYNETLFISLINCLVTKRERGRSGNTQRSSVIADNHKAAGKVQAEGSVAVRPPGAAGPGYLHILQRGQGKHHPACSDTAPGHWSRHPGGEKPPGKSRGSSGAPRHARVAGSVLTTHGAAKGMGSSAVTEQPWF